MAQPRQPEQSEIAEFPAPREGILLTHFTVSADGAGWGRWAGRLPKATRRPAERMPARVAVPNAT
jgi:hypothetical protein